MIGINVKISKQQRLVAARFVTPAVGFDGDKDGVDLRQCFGIVEPQHPTFLRSIVDIEDSEIECLLPVRSTPAPSLETARILYSRLLIEIVGIKDQRFPLGVEDAAVRLLGLSVPLDIVDLCHIEIARAHQVSNVSVVGQKLLLL